jgi:hypothetical protein
MNAKVVLLVIGLVVGAVAGYLTRPATAELKIGPLDIEVQSDQRAAGDGPITSGQWQHIAIFTLIGGAIGLGAGFAVDRRG